MDTVDNVSVVLLNDVCIPGSSEMELSAMLDGGVADATPETIHFSCNITCGYTKKCRQPSGTNSVVESIHRIHEHTRVAMAAYLMRENLILVAEVSDSDPTPRRELPNYKQQLLWQAAESAGDELTLKEKEQLYTLLSDYADVFADHLGDR